MITNTKRPTKKQRRRHSHAEWLPHQLKRDYSTRVRSKYNPVHEDEKKGHRQ